MGTPNSTPTKIVTGGGANSKTTVLDLTAEKQKRNSFSSAAKKRMAPVATLLIPAPTFHKP